MALAQRLPSLLMAAGRRPGARTRGTLPPLSTRAWPHRQRRRVGGGGVVVVLAGGDKSSSSGVETTITTTTTTTSGPRLIHESLVARPSVCDGGLPDPEMCLISSDDEEMVAEEIVVGGAVVAAVAAAAETPAAETATTTATPPAATTTTTPAPPPLHVPPAPEGTVFDEAASRGRWLVGLLVVQSLSSIVLERYEPLIREHLAVTLFLTMLVGAGGNAGNQSAIKVVRSMATGQLDASWASCSAALARQARVAVVLGGGLAAAGYVRVMVAAAMMMGVGGGGGGGRGGAGEALASAVAAAPAATTTTPAHLLLDAHRDAAAISVSLLCIVVSSVLLGTALPFGLARCGVDPVHSGTTIQVASDILGVLVTCLACTFFYSGALDGWVEAVGGVVVAAAGGGGL